MDCNIQNCAFCSAANSTCTVCMPGFQLTSSNTCTNNTCAIAGCSKCASNGQCSACRVGWNFNMQNKTCILVGYGCNDQNCLVCNGPQSCGQCKPGYQVGAFQTPLNGLIGICRPLICPYNITNCMACSISYSTNFNFQKVLCSQCNSGYILVNGFCVTNLTTYGCTVANCTMCSYNNFCSMCTPGFTLTSSGTCLPTSCIIPNCGSCQVNTICGQCNAGFALALGFMRTISSSLQNTIGFVFSAFSQCVPNGISCNVTNCGYCTVNGICASCAPGFDFSTTSPSTCAPVCNITGCLICDEGIMNSCSTCRPTWGMQDDGSCALIPLNCGSGCNNNTCIYNWVNRVSECTSCQSGMILYMGTCYPTTCNIYGCSLCANWATPLYCIQCMQGLIMSNGTCIKPNCNNNIANCINCVQSGPCIGCIQGYLLTTNSSGTAICIQ